MYVIGYQLGRVWAKREASQDQLVRVGALLDGRTWVNEHDDPVSDLRHLVDPDNSDFLDVEELPVPDFIAGFIDGAKSLA